MTIKKNYCTEIIHAIPRTWKAMFLEYGNNISELITNEHYLTKNIKFIAWKNFYCLEKLNSRELYNNSLYLKFLN